VWKGLASRNILRRIEGILLLGWKPRYALDDGLKETGEWYKEHFRKNPRGL